MYEKTFSLPEEHRDKALTFLFEGVYQNAVVYLNGEKIAEHRYGYTEFAADATGKVRTGENTLRVTVDNSLEPNSRWYTGSGVYRPVRLLVGNKVYLPQDTVRITTREADEGFALLDVTAQFREENPDTPVITMSMGSLGGISRISGETFGSCVTFGAHEKPSAPGQFAMKELRQMLDTIHASSRIQ